MFTGTRKRVPFILVIFGLILTACTPGAQAGLKADTTVPVEPTNTPAPTGTMKAPVASPATFGDGVLLYEWREASEVSLLHLIDPETGLDIPGYAPISLGRSYAYAPSPDRNTLAVVVYPSNNSPKGGRLNLIDLQSWQMVTTSVEIDQWNTQMTISPDNQKLAITTGRQGESNAQGELALVDIAQRTALGEVKFDFLPTHIRFTSDSGALMVYGPASWDLSYRPASQAQIVLLNIPRLDVVWRTTLSEILDGFIPNEATQETSKSSAPGLGEGGWMQPAVVFAPDKDTLYIAHAKEDRLTTVDFTSRKVQAVDIHVPMSLLDRLVALTAGVAYAKVPDGNFKTAVISPDGQKLYILGEDIRSTKNSMTGQWETSQTPLGMKVVRTSDGAELGYFDIQASDAAISEDGNTLYLRSWGEYNSNASVPFTLIWDIARQETLARLDGHYLEPGRKFNGEPVLLSNSLYQGKIIEATLDAQTFTLLHAWSGAFYGDWLLVR